MNRISVTVILSLVLISTACTSCLISVQIKNIKHQLPIENSAQYAQYIQALNGLATQEDLANNPLLADILSQQRISLLNRVSDIVLVLVDELDQNNDNMPTLEDLAKLGQIDQILDGFDMINLADFNAQALAQKVAQLQSEGKTIHTLEVSEQLSKLLQAHNQRLLVQSHSEQPASQRESESLKESPENQARQQQPSNMVKSNGTNPTYILKFFFGLMFIIVSLGSLMAIANMQNKKDTLLYAKFIADVGAR